MMLATLATMVALAIGPTANAELTAVMEQRASTETYAELGRLAEAGVPGARALYEGYGALGFAGNGSDFPAACRAWETGASVSAEAAHFTAECYEHGHGGVQDLARAVDLYGQAGDGGFAMSLCALGNLYMAGKGVPVDSARAVELCLRGAKMGNANAQTDLGNFYLLGQGVAEDKVEARRWYERAAEQNQRNALYTLGEMYWFGDTVERDPTRAIGLWEASWNAGRRDAALKIARAYVSESVSTRQTPQLDQALHWYELAIPDIEDPAEKAKAEREREAIRVIRARGSGS